MKHAADALRRADWRTARISHGQARALVQEHHYARNAGNTSVLAMGLFHRDTPEPLGAAIWLPPPRPAAVYTARVLDVPADGVLSLTRLVLHPSVPQNGATFLLGACLRHLRRTDPRWHAAITFADAAHGHTGAIYRASNWIPCGTTTPRRLWIDPRTGAMVAPRTGPPHTRRNVTAEEMVARGYVQTPPSFKYRFVIRIKIPAARAGLDDWKAKAARIDAEQPWAPWLAAGLAGLAGLGPGRPVGAGCGCRDQSSWRRFQWQRAQKKAVGPRAVRPHPP